MSGIEFGGKLITPQDKLGDFIGETVFTGIIGSGAGTIGAIAGTAVGAGLAMGPKADIGYYGRITYTFTQEYKVLSGDYDNHKPMESNTYTRTWVVEQLVNGLTTYETINFLDTNAGEAGIVIYE